MKGLLAKIRPKSSKYQQIRLAQQHTGAECLQSILFQETFLPVVQNVNKLRNKINISPDKTLLKVESKPWNKNPNQW